MIPFAANAAAVAEQWCTEFEWPGKPPKIAPSHWGSAPPSNTWFLGADKNPKWHVDRFSCFCTAQHRVSHYFAMPCYIPPKLPILLGESGPSSNTWYLRPIWVIMKMVSRSV